MKRLLTLRRTLVAVASATALTIGAAAAGAASSLEDARQLYASADYEQALAALGDARDPLSDQYRALCLLALNRREDAEAVLQRLVKETPDFTVSVADVPPRFVALVSDVRRQTLPAVARQLFVDARASFSAKAYDRAMPQFERVLALSAAPDLRTLDGVADLGVLAEGFVELIKTTRSASAAPPAADRPLPAAAKPATRTLPVARQQVVPPWPQAAGRVALAPVGAVSVRINKQGEVVAATMVRPMNPRYDPLLLAAARGWRYVPATLNGEPVEADSVVEIRVAR